MLALCCLARYVAVCLSENANAIENEFEFENGREAEEVIPLLALLLALIIKSLCLSR